MNCPHCGEDVAVVVILTTAAATCAKQIESVAKQIESELTQDSVTCVNKRGSGVSVSGSLFDSVSVSGSLEVDPTEVASNSDYSIDFLQFWALYPRKRNKGDAWKAWKQEKPRLADLLSALSWQCNSAAWLKNAGEFVPYPGTYLRARAWEDEKDAPKARVNGPIAWPHLQGAK